MVAGRSRTFLVAAAVLIAGIALLVAALIASRSGDERAGGPALTSLPAARAWFERDTHSFGQPVRAHVVVEVEEAKIFPETLEVTADVDPYRVIGRPRRETVDLGRTLLIRYSFLLGCFERECLPGPDSTEFEFEPVSLAWQFPPPPGTPRQFRTEGFTTQRLRAAWPPLKVTTRLTDEDVGEGRWRAGLEELPAVTYRASPTALVALLALLAVLGFGVAAASIAVYVRRLRRAAAERRAVEEMHEPSPLEQALAAVTEARGDGNGRARMALEALADELGGAGEHELAREAQRLAWSPADPDDEGIGRLATKVRVVMENGDR